MGGPGWPPEVAGDTPLQLDLLALEHDRLVARRSPHIAPPRAGLWERVGGEGREGEGGRGKGGRGKGEVKKRRSEQ